MRTLRGAILISILAAVVTIGMKAAAYVATGSVGLFSDALESVVNLVAAATAYLSLMYAARPADPSHTYGHAKIEYFASGFEGVLVLVAGAGTAYFAVLRFITPQVLEHIGLGTGIAVGAGAINFITARLLLNLGRQHQSPVVEAEGEHLMTDVWTTLGVVAGLVLVHFTGYTWLDPLLALAVGLNILRIGFRLVQTAFDGLMDRALPAAEQERMRKAIRAALPEGTDFHALRTRRAGQSTFGQFHLLVPGAMTVQSAHDLANTLEATIQAAMPEATITIHVEPIDDATSFETSELVQLGERPGP